MGDFFNVRVAALAFYLGMYTVGKGMFINIKESKFTLFVNPAEAGILPLA